MLTCALFVMPGVHGGEIAIFFLEPLLILEVGRAKVYPFRKYIRVFSFDTHRISKVQRNGASTSRECASEFSALVILNHTALKRGSEGRYDNEIVSQYRPQSIFFISRRSSRIEC